MANCYLEDVIDSAQINEAVDTACGIIKKVNSLSDLGSSSCNTILSQSIKDYKSSHTKEEVTALMAAICANTIWTCGYEFIFIPIGRSALLDAVKKCDSRREKFDIRLINSSL